LTQVKAAGPAVTNMRWILWPAPSRGAQLMKYIHLRADKNGNSYFEDATLALDEADYRPPAPMVFLSHSYQSDGVQFMRLPAGWAAGAIQVSKKQFFVCLKGQVEITTSDGKSRSVGPGDTLLVEDGDSKGHRTRVKGDGECLAMVVPID
jgi:Cupin domain